MLPDETPEVVIAPKVNPRAGYPTDEQFLVAFETARAFEYPTNPRAVIAVLKAQGYREHATRSAMWSLIDRDLIKLNNQFRLEDSDLTKLRRAFEKRDETNSGADTAPQG